MTEITRGEEHLKKQENHEKENLQDKAISENYDRGYKAGLKKAKIITNINKKKGE